MSFQAMKRLGSILNAYYRVKSQSKKSTYTVQFQLSHSRTDKTIKKKTRCCQGLLERDEQAEHKGYVG